VFGVANDLRPPLAPSLGSASAGYFKYRGFERLQALQSTALQTAQARGCQQVGTVIGEWGFDFPITWHAAAMGITARHLTSNADPWPCLIYVEHASGPLHQLHQPSLRSADWRELEARDDGRPYLFVRRTAAPGG
jgi:hypothetical protein